MGFSQCSSAAHWPSYVGVCTSHSSDLCIQHWLKALYLLGQKPLSVFGLSHKFLKRKIQEEWAEKLRIDRGLDVQDRALLKLLRESLVDLGPLED